MNLFKEEIKESWGYKPRGKPLEGTLPCTGNKIRLALGLPTWESKKDGQRMPSASSLEPHWPARVLLSVGISDI